MRSPAPLQPTLSASVAFPIERKSRGHVAGALGSWTVRHCSPKPACALSRPQAAQSLWLRPLPTSPRLDTRPCGPQPARWKPRLTSQGNGDPEAALCGPIGTSALNGAFCVTLWDPKGRWFPLAYNSATIGNSYIHCVLSIGSYRGEVSSRRLGSGVVGVLSNRVGGGVCRN